MKFYIVDDVRSVVKVLDRIIEQKKLGEVVGFSTDAAKAEMEIIAREPDIVLADLLMPVKDGISIVNDVKKVRPNINFIMISQVSDKEMVSEAYRAGVEFFIHKPINIIEVENVVRRVIEKVEMEKTLNGIRGMIKLTGEKEKESAPAAGPKKDGMKDIRYLLGVMGMLGERGTKDILAVCEKCLEQGDSCEQSETLTQYCREIGEDEKVVKQRMRRAMKKGLINMANMGIEDSYNEVFQDYSQLVFEFESLKAEMDYLRDSRNVGGKASIGKFLEGLLIFSEMKEQ